MNWKRNFQPAGWPQAAVVVCWCAAAAVAQGSGLEKFSDLFEDKVLARGSGVEVKRSQLDEAFIAFKANRAARGDRITERERPLQEAQLLDRLVVTQVLINRATEGDRAAAKGLAEKFLAEAKKSAASEDAFNVQLKATGLTPELFNRRVMEQALSEAVIDRELKSKVRITEDQVKDFYENGIDANTKLAEADIAKVAANPKAKPELLADARRQLDGMKKANLMRLDVPERVKVAHVMLSLRNRDTQEPLPTDQQQLKRQQIGRIRERALAGEDFLKLVTSFSEDRGVKETGGIYTLSQSDPFAPEFKAASFSLRTNQVSDVVTTMFGLHVIKLLERIPAKKIEYQKVKGELTDFLAQQELQRLMPTYFTNIKKEAKVEILDPKLNVEEIVKEFNANK